MGEHAQCAVCGGKAEERSEGRGVAVECVVVVGGRGLSHSLFQSLSFSHRRYVTYSLSAPIFSVKENILEQTDSGAGHSTDIVPYSQPEGCFIKRGNSDDNRPVIIPVLAGGRQNGGWPVNSFICHQVDPIGSRSTTSHLLSENKQRIHILTALQNQ